MKQILQKIESGMRVLYTNPFGKRITGIVSYHAQTPGFWVVKPDCPGTLDLIHEEDIITVS